MATLYVTEPGSRIEREYRHLLVTTDEETLMRVPLAHVDEVVLVGQGVGATTPALHALLDAGIGLTLVASTGRLLGRLGPPSGKNMPLRRRQYERAADPAFCLGFARRVVLGKLANSRALALRWTRPTSPPAPLPEGEGRPDPAGEGRGDETLRCLARVEQAMAKAEAAPDLAALRAAEGAGSKAYFAVLRGCLREGFTFERRSRRPPADPANALLSLGYSLLGAALTTALEVVGLDPYEGFYHADKYGRPALALDLLEEFRAPIADSLAVSLINRRMLKPDDFETRGGGVWLSRAGLKLYLREFSDRLQATFTHPLAGRPMSYQKCFEVQARQAAKAITGDAPEYRPLRVR
jgi:CRISPR-associated protein Cas1